MAATATVVAAAFPRISRGVEPITYLQAAAAIVSIATDLFRTPDSNIDGKLGEINAKLDTIIANQKLIIDEIRALRVYINEAFYQSWVNEYSRDIRASRDLYRAYSTPPLNADARTALSTIALDCFRTTLKIGNANFVVFPTFALGVGIVFSIYRLLRYPAQRVTAAKRELAPVLDHWLDKTNPESVPATIETMTQAATARRTALEARPKTFDINETWKREGSRFAWCYYRYVTRVGVGGSFDTGYSATGSTVVKTGESKDYDFYDRPCIKCPLTISEFDADAINARISTQLSRQVSAMKVKISGATTAAVTPVTIPVFSPSGHAYIDELNRERIAIYENLSKIAQLQVLQEELEKFRKLLIS